MEATRTFAEAESQFVTLLDSKPLPVNDLLVVINSIPVKNNKRDHEWANILVQELSEAEDFKGLYQVFKNRTAQFVNTIGVDGICNDLKHVCKDRLILAFLETIPFASQPLESSFAQLDTLLALAPGVQVIDKTWGFGVIKRLDHFYKRITIDFCGKAGHNLTFATASESLALAPHDHILTIKANQPEELKRLIKEEPDKLVKLTIKCYGRMPIPKLEATLIESKILTESEWKPFWDNARKTLKRDPLISIPVKRTDFIEILEQAAEYDDKWFDALKAEKDASAVLAALLELETLNKLDGLSENERAIVNDRLSFAIRGADSTDPALYTRLVNFCHRNDLQPDCYQHANAGRKLENAHAHLWSSNRFIRAAENLPVREIAGMISFLLSEGDEAETKLLTALPQMPYSLLNETLSALRDKPAAALACRTILQEPKAPVPLINWIFRFRNELNDWELPPLIVLLHHAIMVVETNLSGEDLRMQNALKKLFASTQWLKEIFTELNESHRQLLFERIQASPAWDASAHRTLIARMLKLDPALAERKRTVTNSETAQPRLTSWRSLAERQIQYKQLIEVEMPKNSKDIAVARSYGDLRENFEYQAAKDYQRQLLQKQAELQLELELVQGTDFANVASAQVAAGTTVDIRLEDGTMKTFTILGEWDRDEQLNIISNKTAMALSLIGKKTGDFTMIPGSDGEVKAEITAVHPLDSTIKEWIAATPTTA